MKIATHDVDTKVFVIAEIGNNHEGDFGLAADMIAAAAESGVDAVKFQTIVPERLVSVSQKERIAQLSRFQFSYEQYARLADIAQKAGLVFLSTPFDLDSARVLAAFVPAFKIASSDNTFYPLLAEVASTGKPVIMSAGLCNEEELAASIAFMKHAWGMDDVRDRLAVLHCVTAYPTPVDQANLAAVGTLEKMGVTPGYSDHTLGIDAAVLSVACGARILEKHFTLDKNFSDFRDHQLSASPEEMKALVARVRIAERMLGCSEIICSDCEAENRVAVRRSIAARRNLQGGTVLGPEHLDWVRPGNGLAPGMEDELLGKRLKQAVAQGALILGENVE